MSPKDDEGASSTTSSVSNTDQPQTPQLQGDNNPSQIINNEISQSGTVATAENNPVSTSQPAEKVEGTNNVPSEPSSLQPEIPSQPQIRTPAPGNAASEASTSAVASNLVSSQADPTSVAAQDSAVATRTTPQVDKVNLQELSSLIILPAKLQTQLVIYLPPNIFKLVVLYALLRLMSQQLPQM